MKTFRVEEEDFVTDELCTSGVDSSRCRAESARAELN